MVNKNELGESPEEAETPEQAAISKALHEMAGQTPEEKPPVKKPERFVPGMSEDERKFQLKRFKNLDFRDAQGERLNKKEKALLSQLRNTLGNTQETGEAALETLDRREIAIERQAKERIREMKPTYKGKMKKAA